MQSAEEAKDYIQSTLFSKTKSTPSTLKLGFAPRNFESSATILRLRLHGSFVSSLIVGCEREIDFAVQPGRDRQIEIFRWLAKLNGHERAFWFYARDSASGAGEISFVKEARFEVSGQPINPPLNIFETEPAAIGGGAYLGLLGASKKWLLLHNHYAEEEFEIAIHGSVKLCNDLCRLLKCSGTALESDLSADF